MLIVGVCLIPLNLACSVETTSEQGKQQDISMVIATTSDVTVGMNRIGFSLFNLEGEPISEQRVTVEAIFYPPNSTEGMIKNITEASWMSITGTSGRGLYIADIEFDVSGAGTQQNPNYWELVSSFQIMGEEVWSKAAIVVEDESSVVGIGAKAPRSITLTGDSIQEIKEISTDPDPDSDLYEISIHEAVTNGRPTIIVFATPALCVSQVCGPIVDSISKIKDRYSTQADFIHIEVFENPKDLVEQGRFTGKQVKAVEEWGLITEPWVFVVDDEGNVAYKFEIFVTEEEIVESIETVIN